jgi:2-polyprenyl-6-methoxyphenol hydroxylase-like FAD-dependent oxidoreductase
MPLSRNLPVLIAGGGIGGLAAALALSKIGRASVVLEQAGEFKEVGAGIQISPNVFKMFDALGITDAIKQIAVFPESLTIRDALTAEQVMHIPLGPDFLERFRHPYGVIYRPDLLDALLQACRRSSLISLHTGKSVVHYEDHGAYVRAQTEEGESIDSAALIGADGLWSRIRERIVGDGQPRVAGHIAYRAVLPIDKAPEHARERRVTLWAGPKIHLVHYPLRRGELLNLVAVFHSDRYDEGWDKYGDPEELNEKFKLTRPEVRELLGLIEAWRMWVLCDRDPVKNWSTGRVTLLGDSAHPTLQYMAQGGCMAIEDAVVLAQKIDALKGDFERAFVAYQEERYLRTARVQLTSRFVGDYVYHPRGPAAEVRNQMIKNITREDMAWLYDGI